jgi:hypothetical protein
MFANSQALGIGLLAAGAVLAAAPAQAVQPLATLAATGCTEQDLELVYPALAFQKMLPDGFKLVTLDPTGLAAEVDISINRCAALDGGAGTEAMIAFVAVTPPVEYQNSSFEGYGLALQMWSSDPRLLSTFGDWGFGGQSAAASFSFGSGLMLDGALLNTIKLKSADAALNVTALENNNPTLSPAGISRAFAVDAAGKLHIIDALFSQQLSTSGVGTLIQDGKLPLPLPLPTQPLPVFSSYTENYALTLYWVQ